MKLPLRIESRLAILIGVLFGIPAVIFVPPVATFDGPNHYLRALQVSEGQMRAERFSERAVGGILPRSHADFVNSMLWNYYWRAGADFMRRGQWQDLSSQEARVAGSRPVEFTNTAIYSPVNYAFQSTGMRLAAVLSPEPLLACRMGCLFNLAGYLLLVMLAIECTPRFQQGILLLATCPLLMTQAFSLSADAINFALPLLLFAWTWRLRFQDVKHPFGELAAVFSLGLLVTLLKPTLFVTLGCLVLVPARYFGGSRFAKAASLSLFSLVAAGVWFAWNRAYVDVDVARWFDPGRPAMAVQEHWFIGNPLRFAGPFLYLVTHDLAGLWPHLYGDPGSWISRDIYRFNAALSVIFLAGFLGCASWNERPSRAWAAGMLIISSALVLTTGLTLWLTFGAVGMGFIPGFVGRYLFVPVLGVGMAWAEFSHHGFLKTRKVLFWSALAANAVGLAAIVVPVAIRTF
jgi:uncharacterized membrane protein